MGAEQHGVAGRGARMQLWPHFLRLSKSNPDGIVFWGLRAVSHPCGWGGACPEGKGCSNSQPS